MNSTDIISKLFNNSKMKNAFLIILMTVSTLIANAQRNKWAERIATMSPAEVLKMVRDNKLTEEYTDETKRYLAIYYDDSSGIVKPMADTSKLLVILWAKYPLDYEVLDGAENVAPDNGNSSVISWNTAKFQVRKAVLPSQKDGTPLYNYFFYTLPIQTVEKPIYNGNKDDARR
jgi:hypothetical protein